jgi:hypothetical protein
VESARKEEAMKSKNALILSIAGEILTALVRSTPDYQKIVEKAKSIVTEVDSQLRQPKSPLISSDQMRETIAEIAATVFIAQTKGMKPASVFDKPVNDSVELAVELALVVVK